MKKILVTTALPYANGSIHLGHLLEGIQADIFVRYQRLAGNKCYFFCADDTHGTPVMLAARKEGISPEDMIGRIHTEHYQDLSSFHISYDNYYTTNSPENRYFSETIYLSLKKEGNIEEKEIEQLYCEHDKMFLPDRFIKGECPKCASKDQYGDGCEVCGSAYSPADLKSPACAICGRPPVPKKSKHLFLHFRNLNEYLQEWINNPLHVHSGVKNKLQEWFREGLSSWDISRDGPYFGFEIPGEKNKYFYVWLDAPIGYMASSKNYFEKNSPSEFDEFWKKTDSDVIHFVGKDIMYFHTLFWPALLKGGGYRSPSRVNVHGFLTVNGEKMSKSRGTFIKASVFLKHQDPEHFRFYLAGKLNDSLDDVDLNFEDYANKVNADLIGNFVNIFSRTGTSLLDKLDRTLGKMNEEGKALFQECVSFSEEIQKNYSERMYSRNLKEILHLGDKVNKYINDKAPWSLIKTDREQAGEVVTAALNCGRVLAVYLSPIIPKTAEKIFRFLGEKENGFKDISRMIENRKVEAYEMLSKRVDTKAIELMTEESKIKEEPKETKSPEAKEAGKVSESGYIKIDDLAKVELRVGLITEASAVEGADKLVNVKVDLGEKGIKNVFAGIKAAYSPEELKGLKVVVVANLEPRKMKFGVSEAMLLASGKENTLSLFVPHRNANPGDLLK